MLDLFDLEPKDRLVAQLLLSQGMLNQQDFQAALRKASESFFFSFAEILVGLGLVSLNQLEAVLHDYCSKLRLGELAVARGLVTPEERDMVVSAHEQRDGRIGELFVELHLATPRQIEMLLDYQRRCRTEVAAC